MKENLNSKPNRLLKNNLDVPPTLEMLRDNFPHLENCSQSAVLKQTEKMGYVDGSGKDSGWVIGPYTMILKTYLECTECHVKKRC